MKAAIIWNTYSRVNYASLSLLKFSSVEYKAISYRYKIFVLYLFYV